MPNYCDFKVKITGPVKGMERFYNACNNEYHSEDDPNEHFYRIFEFEFDEDVIKNDIGTVHGYGYCAWSVWSCMFDGPYTYHNSAKHTNGITVDRLAKEEGLVIEIYSNEIGMEFAEHFLINRGEILIDEETFYSEITYEDSYEEFIERTKLNWTEEQWKEYFEKEDVYVICNWGDMKFTDTEKIFKGEK